MHIERKNKLHAEKKERGREKKKGRSATEKDEKRWYLERGKENRIVDFLVFETLPKSLF